MSLSLTRALSATALKKLQRKKNARRTSRVRPLQRSRACTHAWSGRRASIALLTGRRRVQSKSKTKRRRRFEGGGSALGGRARKRLCDHYLFTWSSRCADAADSLAFTCSCNTRSFSGNSRCSCCIWRNSAMYARSRVKNMAARERDPSRHSSPQGRPPAENTPQLPPVVGADRLFNVPAPKGVLDQCCGLNTTLATALATAINSLCSVGRHVRGAAASWVHHDERSRGGGAHGSSPPLPDPPLSAGAPDSDASLPRALWQELNLELAKAYTAEGGCHMFVPVADATRGPQSGPKTPLVRPPLHVAT